MLHSRFPLAAALVSMVSCAPSSQPAPTVEPSTAAPRPRPESYEPAPPPERDPVADLEAVERAALEPGLRVRFAVTAQGAVTATMQGLLVMSDERVTLDADGSFAGATVELRLVSDGKRLTSRGGAATVDIPEPAHLREAFAIGLVRMGILHNLAVLVGGRPPDGGDGGVREWVQPTDVRSEPIAGAEAPAAQAIPISFGLTVAGRPSGEATLWVDARSGLPTSRNQVLTFPEGEMVVHETYDWDP